MATSRRPTALAMTDEYVCAAAVEEEVGDDERTKLRHA